MAPAALASPSDLDPSWGSGGLAVFPAGDRYDAQYAPLMQRDGKVLTAGLLRNSSDRVFVARLNANGSVDTSFGSDGELHTNSVAPHRTAPTTLTPDGRPLVVAGSSKDGRIVLERFAADGLVDTTFGTSSSGRLVVDVGGTYVKPTGVVALSNTSTLVTALSNAGGTPAMTLLKFTNSGLDSRFGSKGIARATFGTTSGAYDLSVLGNGSILVAGALGDPATPGADVALSRFTAAGVLDKTFDGDGKATYDLSPGAADYARSVATDASGSFTVTGPAAGKGMVARFSSTGARDSGFASNGVQLGGFAAIGTTVEPVDVTLDAAGRIVIVAKATTGSGLTAASKWLVARLARTAADPFDRSFSATGATILPVCSNTAGYGPSGVAILPNDRIDVLGSCSDQGQVAVVRLFGTDAFLGNGTFSVTPAGESAGHERVPLANIDPTIVLGAVTRFQSTTLGSGPMGSGPMGSGPMGSGPMGSGPMGSGPMGSGPMGSGPMGSGPMGSGPMGSGPMGSGPIADQILLSDLPLLNGSWTELLVPYYADGVPPLQTITLGDVYRIAPSVIDNLTYGDVDISRTPLRHASLAAVMLTRPIEFIAPPPGGWCQWLAGTSQPKNCSNGVSTSTTTLLELEFAGDDLSAYYASPLSLSRASGTNLGTGSQRATLAYLQLRQVDVARTPLGAVPASEVAPLLKCNPNCTGTVAQQQAADVTGWTTATIGDLVARLPLPSLPDLSLGQLLAGMVNTGEIPYEQAPAEVLLAAAELRSADLQTYSAGFTIDCLQSAGLELVPQLADDARLIPGSATAAIDSGNPAPIGNARRSSDGKLAYDLASSCSGHTGTLHMDVAFKAEPGSRLGPRDASLLVRSAFGRLQAPLAVTVDDSIDPGDDFAQTRPLTTGKIVESWISDARDVDHYTFPSPPEGTVISITLSHLPADLDLTVFGPGADITNSALRSGPMGSGPMGSGPMGSGPVPDSTGDNLDQTLAEPDTVQDLPMGSGPMGSGPMGSGPMGSGSINRGMADEAVTYRVRKSDVGGTFTVRVSGYNGATSDRPYVLRRMDLVPPPAPPCAARSDLSSGSPGAWPSSIPGDTEALYLVNRRRLSALDGSAGADDVMAKLTALAAVTKGVVVPVESAPGVETGPAYSAWDADPCDEGKANDVVERVNAVVDDVRAAGNGLPKLRSIVLVGPDAVIPQARLRDDAVLSNESEYADDARFGANDDAVSGALRDGYIVTDDAYGDFDPTRTMYLPDVALGRLVESAPEIAAQIQRYLDVDGVISPDDAVVFGYDLFTDGAQAEAAPLGTTADVGNWDAAAALAAINRNATGYSAVNGHYDHYRGLPAAAFSRTGAPDFLLARDAHPKPGSYLFTMGCHAGLNISAQVANPTTLDRLRLGDWAQRMAQERSLWTASTTYSYGDTETVAYTESILAEAAANLAARSMTVGQALMFAKQRSLATVGVLDRYYTKSSMAATFYGLPMYRLGADGGVGASGMPPAATGGAGVRTSDPVSFPLDDSHLTRHDTDRGSYWTADGGDAIAVQNHPIEPVVSKDVTSSNGRAKAFLIEALQTEDLTGVDPVIVRPTVDLAAHEPEPPVRSPLFPARLSTVTPEATAGGRRDRLTVAAGQFRGDRQRLFRSISGRVLRLTTDTENRLAIRRVDGGITAGTFSVRVDTEGGNLLGGNVLYRTNGDTGPIVTWHRADLAVLGANVLGTGGALPSGDRIVEAFVQVYNTTHDLALSDFKVAGYSFVEVARPGAGDPRITLTPDVPAGGYLQTSPQIGLDPGSHSSARFEYSLDGGPWTPFAQGTTLAVVDPVDGEHVVRFRGSDGSSALRQFAIDRAAPTLVGEVDRRPDANGWYNAPVTVTWRCADAVSGVASCPAPTTLTSEGSNVSASASATDRAGNVGSGSISGIKIDRTPPTATASVRGTKAPNPDWYLAREPLDPRDPAPASPTATFACTDALSGVDTCPGDMPLSDDGGAQTREGTATDRAGNKRAATTGPVNVDGFNPTVSIGTPGGSILLLGQEVQGRASDTAAGSGIGNVAVTYRPTIIGTSETVTARLVCGSDHSCTWTARAPSLGGTYRVTATATEVSGRTATTPEVTVTFSLS